MQQRLGALLTHMYGIIKFKNICVNFLGVIWQEEFWRKWLSSSTPSLPQKNENGYLTTEVFIFFKQGSWLRPTTVLQTVAAFKPEL